LFSNHKGILVSFECFSNSVVALHLVNTVAKPHLESQIWADDALSVSAENLERGCQFQLASNHPLDGNLSLKPGFVRLSGLVEDFLLYRKQGLELYFQMANY
jgi:hypothetical protein